MPDIQNITARVETVEAEKVIRCKYIYFLSLVWCIWKPSRSFYTLLEKCLSQIWAFPACWRTFWKYSEIPCVHREWLEVGSGCEPGSSALLFCILHPVPGGELSPEAKTRKLAVVWLFPLNSLSDVCPAHTAERCRRSTKFKENTINFLNTYVVSGFQCNYNGVY